MDADYFCQSTSLKVSKSFDPSTSWDNFYPKKTSIHSKLLATLQEFTSPKILWSVWTTFGHSIDLVDVPLTIRCVFTPKDTSPYDVYPCFENRCYTQTFVRVKRCWRWDSRVGPLCTKEKTSFHSTPLATLKNLPIKAECGSIWTTFGHTITLCGVTLIIRVSHGVDVSQKLDRDSGFWMLCSNSSFAWA